jgi:hypothetical protein
LAAAHLLPPDSLHTLCPLAPRQLIAPPPAAKRARGDQGAGSGTAAAPVKQARLGMKANQWVTVYDKRPLMKQR